MLYETIRQADLRVKLGIMTVFQEDEQEHGLSGSSVVLFLILLVWHVFQKDAAVVREERGIHRSMIVWFEEEDRIFLWEDQTYF